MTVLLQIHVTFMSLWLTSPNKPLNSAAQNLSVKNQIYKAFIVTLSKHSRRWLAGGLLSFLTAPAFAEQSFEPEIKVGYGNKGFEFKTQDDNFLLQIQTRLQLRASSTDNSEPLTVSQYQASDSSEFGINRARLKIGGHGYRPWLKYYLEYELHQGYLLDYRLMVEKYDWLKFKAGQWKFEYSRERVISSGAQQMMDRSILNRAFTIDRQQGAAIYGHLNSGTPADMNYWLGVGTGSGRGSNENDDNHALYYGRLQWNRFGREMGFTPSDFSISEQPVGSIAVAGTTYRSAFTRFSSSGGGHLPDFEVGERGQYDVDQYLIETALLYKGFSWQSEYHQKTVTDRLNNNFQTDLEGYYVQGGYFFHQAFDWWPEPLEAAFRYATYEQSDMNVEHRHYEQALALNYFFSGHKNKLTADVTHFELDEPDVPAEDRWRFRIQWDVSF